MCKYSIGDVIWGIVPFSDGTGFKFRPTIVIDLNPNICKYLIVECSTLKDKHTSSHGIIIKPDDANFLVCGFEEPTIIVKNKCWILEKHFKPHPRKGSNPIGKCTFLNKVKSLFD